MFFINIRLLWLNEKVKFEKFMVFYFFYPDNDLFMLSIESHVYLFTMNKIIKFISRTSRFRIKNWILILQTQSGPDLTQKYFFRVFKKNITVKWIKKIHFFYSDKKNRQNSKNVPPPPPQPFYLYYNNTI